MSSPTTGNENGVYVMKNITFNYKGAHPRLGILTGDGDLLIGSSSDPDIIAKRGNIVSGDSTLIVAYNEPNIDLSVGLGIATTYTTDAGDAIPALNILNILGTAAQGLSTSGAGSTVTLTNADWTTAQKGVGTLATDAEAIAGAVTNEAIVPSSLNAKLGTQTLHGVALGAGSTAALAYTAVGTDGQVLIAATGANPAFATLTSSDASITFTPGANSLSIQVSGAAVGKTITGDSGGALTPTLGNWNIVGLSGSKTSGSGSTLTIKSPPFSDVGGSGTSVLNSGEFVTAAVTRTLPATAGLADGDLVIYVTTTAGALVITANTGQTIQLGSNASSVAGTCTSSALGDSISLRWSVTATKWFATSSIGNWSLA